MNSELRKDCPMRHKNGNCTPCGGFCTAVNDPICKGLHNAYDTGVYVGALRAQEERERNDPLTLKELRKMGGEPGWCSESQCYGIIKVEKIGRWANTPFFVGAWHNNKVAINFEWDIKKRGLTIYRHKPSNRQYGTSASVHIADELDFKRRETANP